MTFADQLMVASSQTPGWIFPVILILVAFICWLMSMNDAYEKGKAVGIKEGWNKAVNQIHSAQFHRMQMEQWAKQWKEGNNG